MDIILNRLRHTPWGVDGKLSINGQQVAFTTEHPSRFRPPGTYPVTLQNMPFVMNNGPMKSLKGEISVGELQCAGLVIKTRATYKSLYDRIQKSLKRGHNINLIIIEQ